MAAEGPGTRDRILDAAVELLATGGLDDVRINRVAQLAGVSAPSVHYHFETREQLVGAALERSFDVAADSRSASDAEAEGRPAAERIAEKVEASLPLPGRQLHEWSLWIELWLQAAREPRFQAPAARLYERLHSSLRELLDEGAQAGEFSVGDPDAVAERTLALIDGLGVRALMRDPRVTVEHARDAVLADLERELGVSLRR